MGMPQNPERARQARGEGFGKKIRTMRAKGARPGSPPEASKVRGVPSGSRLVHDFVRVRQRLCVPVGRRPQSPVGGHFLGALGELVQQAAWRRGCSISLPFPLNV